MTDIIRIEASREEVERFGHFVGYLLIIACETIDLLPPTPEQAIRFSKSFVGSVEFLAKLSLALGENPSILMEKMQPLKEKLAGVA